LQVQQVILSAFTKLAIWKIEEPLPFFLDQTPYDALYFSTIHHPEKQLEFAASRYLAAQLSGFPANALIQKHPNRMPYFTNLPQQVSLSHTHGMVAAMVSTSNAVGIDIEKIDVRMLRIRQRFIHDNELPVHLNESAINQIARCWCVKEAVFKALKEHSITFITDFIIVKWEGETAWVQVKTPQTNQLINVPTFLLNDYAVAYCDRNW